MGSATLPKCGYPFLLLIMLLILVAYWPPPGLPLSFKYSLLNMSSESQNFIAMGDVSFDNTDYVELSKFDNEPQNISVGRLYYKDQLPLWDSLSQEVASFNCSFTFEIIPIADVVSADGLSFFLLDPSHSDIPQNSSGGWLGLLNATTNGSASAGVVAIEFDVLQDDAYDPNDNHVGIDINSIVSAKTSSPDFDLVEALSVSCWVDYSASGSLLEVYVTNVSGSPAKPSFPLLSYSVNLALVLPENVLIGFSASSTGQDGYEYHRIYAWAFNSSTSLGGSTSAAPTPPASQALPPDNLSHQPSTSDDKKGSNHVGIIVGVVSAAILTGIVLTVLMLYQMRKRRAAVAMPPPPPPQHLGPQEFSDTDLCRATNNFSENCFLGKGGFGPVYKGVLQHDGSEIAVKCISQQSAQGEKEFRAEVDIISRIRHKNLVQLKGWCNEDGKPLLLVYEYLPNGSLDHYLFSKSPTMFLNWSQRYNIVCGLGSALLYLHESCERVIVHRDIKASNVMLDANYNAKLGDFGLARQLGEGAEAYSTRAAGTLGYMSPETYKTSQATTYSDVYSYGIVLLEVACGRHPFDTSLPAQFQGFLLNWVWDLHSTGKLIEACDGRLGGSFDEEQLVRTLAVGLTCTVEDPKARPYIHDALEALQGRVPLPSIARFKPMNYDSGSSIATASSSVPSIGSSVS